MRDRDVRNALHRRVLRDHHDDPNTLVLNELGLRHGRCRVDIAVVNGMLHGFELKSDKDTLERLPHQIATYGAILDKATLVVGEKHAPKAIPDLPKWWGIKIAYKGSRGAISFENYKAAARNPSINPVALAELLWKNEVSELLELEGYSGSVLRRPRAFQYALLAEVLKIDVLRDAVRSRLKARENWRGLKPSSICGD